MTTTQANPQNEIARQVSALRKRQRRLAALSPAEAKRESLALLKAAGIVTKQGKLAVGYR